MSYIAVVRLTCGRIEPGSQQVWPLLAATARLSEPALFVGDGVLLRFASGFPLYHPLFQLRKCDRGVFRKLVTRGGGLTLVT